MKHKNRNTVAPHAGPRPVCLNHLRRGEGYLATTLDGAISRGIYLGMENVHGDRSILLAGSNDTSSIKIGVIESVEHLPLAA